MWAVQGFGIFLYEAVLHKPFAAPSQIWSPALEFVFDLVLWIFGFGYLMGEYHWQKQERDFHKGDPAA